LQASFLGWQVQIECADRDLAPLVDTLYRGFRCDGATEAVPDRFLIARSDEGRWRCQGPSDSVEVGHSALALGWLDDALTIGAQDHRRDLFFIHSAAIVRDGRVALLIAESGGGKSMTTWGALHHGFALLSDELAPVELGGLLVHAYPRAICLKADPPAAYPLPPEGLRLGRVRCVGLDTVRRAPAAPLAVVAYVSYHPEDEQPSLRPIGPAESTARLYANSLNALAHQADGIDAAVAIASRARSFVLRSGDLRRTCALLAAALDG
jgi:hypothetical protein